MTPVMVLSDGYLANGTEPFRIPDVGDLPDVPVRFAEPPAEGEFRPYLRDADTLGRPWARPGTAGLEHRIGGLEKSDGTGNVDYDPANHEHMIRCTSGIDIVFGGHTHLALLPPKIIKDASNRDVLVVVVVLDLAIGLLAAVAMMAAGISKMPWGRIKAARKVRGS